MKPIKLPKMEDEEMNKVIQNENICRIAFIDQEYPYIAPFQYLYMNGFIYFHFTDYGKKKEILSKNNNVCVSIEKFTPNMEDYCFISMQGKLELVKNEEDRELVIKKMIDKAKKKYSENFLSAHGFEKTKGWEAFISHNQLIYKLDNICYRIGLKSK